LQHSRLPAKVARLGEPTGQMKKLILLSVIIASITFPARAARAKSGKAGLRKALIQVAIFNFIYLILVTMVWFKMAP
jgi:hypothetical protein